MRSDRNVMMNPKPGEYARKMSFSQWHGRLGRKRNNKLELTHRRIVWSQSLVSSDFAAIHCKQRTQLLSLYLNQHLWWYFLSSSFNQLCPDGRQSQRCMFKTTAIFAGLLFLFFCSSWNAIWSASLPCQLSCHKCRMETSNKSKWKNNKLHGKVKWKTPFFPALWQVSRHTPLSGRLSLRASSPFGGSREKSRESSTRIETRVRGAGKENPLACSLATHFAHHKWRAC